MDFVSLSRSYKIEDDAYHQQRQWQQVGRQGAQQSGYQPEVQHQPEACQHQANRLVVLDQQENNSRVEQEVVLLHDPRQTQCRKVHQLVQQVEHTEDHQCDARGLVCVLVVIRLRRTHRCFLRICSGEFFPIAGVPR